jgi:hypothetical protein
MESPARRPWRPAETAFLVAVLLVILGSKLALIDAYGSITPFWDQWDAQADRLFKPYLEGTLSLPDLLAAHNEHRILVGRLFSLALLELSGVWNPVIEMAANAVLHVVVIAFLLVLVAPDTGRGRLALFAACGALFAVPFGWENTLAGFQSHFYLLLGFSVACLALCHASPAFSRRWLGGIGCAFAAYFCLSSGLMAVLALLTASALQMASGARQRSRREVLGLAVLAALFGIGLAFTTHVPGHDPLKAQSVGQLAEAFIKAASWPFDAPAGLVFNLPAMLLALRIVLRPERAEARDWLLLTLFLWLGAQWLAVSYSRAVGPTSSRYTDLLALGPLLNLCAVIRLIGAMDRLPAWVRGPWFFGGLLAAAAVAALPEARRAVSAARARGALYERQTENVQAYLASGDIGHLRDKPYLHVPHFVSERLAGLLDDPTIRSLLSPGLTGELWEPALHLPDGVTRAFREFALTVVGSGQLIAGIGLGLAIATALVRAGRVPPGAGARPFATAMLALALGVVLSGIPGYRPERDAEISPQRPAVEVAESPAPCVGFFDHFNGQPVADLGSVPRSDLFTVSGWLAGTGAGGGVPDEALVGVRMADGSEAVFATEPVSRDDVRAHLGDPGLPDVGFSATIDLARRPEARSLRIIGAEDGEFVACPNLTLDFAAGDG